MILVKIRKYYQVQGVQHTATSWKVATDPFMQNLLDYQERSNMLELYFSNIEVPKGETYYVQARRHFNLANMDYDLDPIAVTNQDQTFSNLLFTGDNYIEHPYITINKDELMDNDDATLTFKTSKFKSPFDKHKATHYIILDHNNKVIFARMNETKHLTELEIPNSWEYRDKYKVTFIAIHVGVSGMESKPSKKIIYFNKDINWGFDVNITALEPNIDHTINFTALDNNKLNIRKVEMYYPTSGELAIKWEEPPITSVTIPWYLLNENVQYDLHITHISNGYKAVTIKKLSTLDFNVMPIRDEEYIYKNEVKVEAKEEFYLPDNLQLETMYNGNILIPKITKRVDIYRWDSVNKRLIKTTSNATGLRMLNDNITNTLIKPITRSLIVIDSLNEQGLPTFLLYRYNQRSDDYTLLSTVTRGDETHPLGVNGAFVQTDIDKILYIPYGTNVIKEYNISKQSVDTIFTIPAPNMTKGLLLRGRSNRLMICNSDTYEAFNYNIHTNKVTEGYQFTPSTFINRELRAIHLMNGNTLIYSADPDMDMTSNSVMYYNRDTMKFITANIQFEVDKVPNTSIFTNTGEILLYKTETLARDNGQLYHGATQYMYN